MIRPDRLSKLATAAVTSIRAENGWVRRGHAIKRDRSLLQRVRARPRRTLSPWIFCRRGGDFQPLGVISQARALGKVRNSQQDDGLLLLSVVFVARLLLDRAAPAIERGQARLLAALSRAEMLDESFHRDRARLRLIAVFTEKIDDVPSQIPAANLPRKRQSHFMLR